MAILKKISLNNFRVFKDKTGFELAPITILTGANNSGKSSVLKALLLWESNSDFDTINDLIFKNGRHDLGEFGLAKSGTNETMDFEFTYEGIPLNLEWLPDAECTILLSYTRDNGSGKLKSFKFFYTDVLLFSVEYENERKMNAYYNLPKLLTPQIENIDFISNYVTFNHTFNVKGLITNTNMIANALKKNEKPYDIFLNNAKDIASNRKDVLNRLEFDLYNPFNAIEYHLRTSFQQLFHLDYTSANRSRAQRAYTRAIAPYTYDTFSIYTKKDLNYDDAKVREFVHFWMTNKERGFGLVEDLDIFMENETIFVRIKHNGGMRGNLTEVGFSVAQILPLVVRIAINDTQFALVEEPETNLHPKLQARLADMFMEAYTKFGTRFIVETHSEYFIRKLQFHTAKGNIKPEDTAVYYLYDPNDERAADEPQVKRLYIDENGNFDTPFGTGFFDESTNLMMDIYRAKA
jgi:predicted ATP-dependent endonuclease of OLD family